MTALYHCIIMTLHPFSAPIISQLHWIISGDAEMKVNSNQQGLYNRWYWLRLCLFWMADKNKLPFVIAVWIVRTQNNCVWNELIPQTTNNVPFPHDIITFLQSRAGVAEYGEVFLRAACARESGCASVRVPSGASVLTRARLQTCERVCVRPPDSESADGFNVPPQCPAPQERRELINHIIIRRLLHFISEWAHCLRSAGVPYIRETERRGQPAPPRAMRDIKRKMELAQPAQTRR